MPLLDVCRMLKGQSTSSSETIKLQLEHWESERSIKLKAISEREAVELLYARKRFALLKSQLKHGSTGECEHSLAGLDDTSSDGNNIPQPVDDHFNDTVSTSSSNPSETTNCVPTSQQICARQVMSMDLPVFTGDPEDWPLFYSQYNNSTLACGFSNSENLVRLQRCVKGKALEYVRSSLLVPELVPKVIQTLKMLYGRPEVLINSLINKIRTISPPNIDRLETVIEYGMAIQNLLDHLTAMNQMEHLRNPSLLQELEAKLPGEMKMDWARYKRVHVPPSLKTLNEFMNERVEAVCELTFVGLSSRSQTASVNIQNEDASFDNDSRIISRGNYRPRSCLVCGRQNHHVRDCEEFQSHNVSHRWRLVGQLRLCRCCLGRHSTRICSDVLECGVNRCQLLHHPLLHQLRVQ